MNVYYSSPEDMVAKSPVAKGIMKSNTHWKVFVPVPYVEVDEFPYINDDRRLTIADAANAMAIAERLFSRYPETFGYVLYQFVYDPTDEALVEELFEIYTKIAADGVLSDRLYSDLQHQVYSSAFERIADDVVHMDGGVVSLENGQKYVVDLSRNPDWDYDLMDELVYVSQTATLDTKSLTLHVRYGNLLNGLKAIGVLVSID